MRNLIKNQTNSCFLLYHFKFVFSENFSKKSPFDINYIKALSNATRLMQ